MSYPRSSSCCNYVTPPRPRASEGARGSSQEIFIFFFEELRGAPPGILFFEELLSEELPGENSSCARRRYPHMHIYNIHMLAAKAELDGTVPVLISHDARVPDTSTGQPKPKLPELMARATSTATGRYWCRGAIRTETQTGMTRTQNRF